MQTALIVSITPLLAFAATHTVQPNGLGDFPTIQAAVNAAVDGDVIELTDGVFNGPGNRNVRYHGKAITIRSHSGDPQTCIVDVEGEFNGINERAFSFDRHEGPDAVLAGITIINGNADGPCPGCDGGAVFCHDASPTIENVVFAGNNALLGGALYAFLGSPRVINCRFIGNSAESGGGVFFDDNTEILFDRCVFYGNEASVSGGAIAGEPYSTVTVTNATLSHNASPDGGGIAMRHGNWTITNTLIAFSSMGEGVFPSSAPTLSISYCDIYGNRDGDWTGILSDLLGVDGNVAVDPLFLRTVNAGGDCRIVGKSPCIDAGDPKSPPDPDGTVADIGAHYFSQMARMVAGATDALDDEPRDEMNAGKARGTDLSFRITRDTVSNDFVARFELPEPTPVRLQVFDLRGRERDRPLQTTLPAGRHAIAVTTADLPSGLYLYRLQAGSHVVTRKLSHVH